MRNPFKKKPEPRVIDSVEALALLEEVVRENGAEHTAGPYFVSVSTGTFECITAKILEKLGYPVEEVWGACMPYQWGSHVTVAEFGGKAPRRVQFTGSAAMLLDHARTLNDHDMEWGHIFTELSGVDLDGVPVRGSAG